MNGASPIPTGTATSCSTIAAYERFPGWFRSGALPAQGVVDADTLMLYDYLKQHDGICASHTSATGMGTDWRDVNPQFEPFVEIYQGHRQSYEYLGAPRAARRKGRVDWRLAAAGHGLERPGHAVQDRLRGLERPYLDPHQLWRGPGRGRLAQGDPRCLPPPALLRRHR